MERVTNTELKIIEIIKKNPYLEQEEIALRLGMSRSAVAGHLARLIKKGVLQRGYILNELRKEIAVIGGANVDIKGTAEVAFRKASSNPGYVSKSAGGVARNVAENLARLEMAVTLYSVVGLDSEGEWLIDRTKAAGVNVQSIDQLADERTGIYLSILDDSREQIASISDMMIMERIDLAYIKNIVPKLLGASMVFLDANLPMNTLQFLINWLHEQHIPIIIDPVSAKKAEKLKNYLSGIYIITPNREEAEMLTGLTIKTDRDIKLAAEKLIAKGVEQVVITLGEEGVYVANVTEQFLLPSPSAIVKDTTGAGDAFIAGMIYGLSLNMNLIESCRYGNAMASLTLASNETVVTELTDQTLEIRKREIDND